MKTVKLDERELERALAVRDLTDRTAGPHAIQSLVDQVVEALRAAQRPAEVRELRGPRVVTVADNYYDLGVPREGVTLDARWITAETILRTHMSALVPRALRALAADASFRDVLLTAPGLVYRRDRIGPIHASEPHQLDLWHLRRGPFDDGALRAMIDAIMTAVLPGRRFRVNASMAPYADDVLQIDVEDRGRWIEVGECGRAHRGRLLGPAGLAEDVQGLGMGLGLDRLVMLRKGIPDIRTLRASSPALADQMLDLSPFRPLPVMDAITTELAVVVHEELPPEELGDRTRTALGDRARSIEELCDTSQRPYQELGADERAALGVREGEKHMVLRLVVRDLERALTSDEVRDLQRAVATTIGALPAGNPGSAPAPPAAPR